MDCVNLISYIDSTEFEFSLNKIKDLENYLEDKLFDENLFDYLFEILQKINSKQYEFLEFILKKVQPVKPTKHLTFDIIYKILNLIFCQKIDVLLMLEPFVVELKSGKLRKIFEIINPGCISITRIIKAFIHKIPKIKGKDFCAILYNLGKKEELKFLSDMAKLEFIEQITCKLDCYIGRIPQILKCFDNLTNIRKAMYHIIINAPDFDMNYYGFVETCKRLNEKSRLHFIEGFILAREKHGWDFPDKDLTQYELCQKLKELLDVKSYQEFVKVFIDDKSISDKFIIDSQIEQSITNFNGDNTIYPTFETLDKLVNDKISNFFTKDISNTSDIQSIIVSEDKNIRNTTLIYASGKKIIYQQKID
ncbi:hypothetical protein QLL95_gp0139 [Cotonvirus japonicus]|uniref:Uncharacterized protein n=1 Tax=Cotonvirus japonicus TaxID=2811091 RepID=A0ABM7NR38_9VIRU|nr:hypothetical protein QLL95_gp0139 [Cotonvirus japonicus]BCS82628.1 hypothetical protein [Cotonvirus japonicus]